MEKFIISPDDCLILKAFKDSRSLREAAQLLECDPAGLARRVQNISTTHGFLQKVNNRWQVTARGLDLVAWAEASIQTQKKIFSAKNSLRIASTVWFSEEVLIPELSKLQSYMGGKTTFSLSVPKKGFEMALLDGSVDFVIACHPPAIPEIEHKQVAPEKWTLIAPASWRKDLNLKSDTPLEQLQTRPFIRHHDINEDLFFPRSIRLQDSGISIDNLIGIRAAVSAGLGWSLVPRLLIERHLKQAKMIELPYELPVRDRKVCVWWLRNRSDVRLSSNKLSAWLKATCES